MTTPSDATTPATVRPTSTRLEYVSPEVGLAETRRRRRTISLSVAMLALGVAAGAGLNAVDDASNRLPRYAAQFAFAAAGAAAVALLAAGAAVLARARVATAVVAVVVVLAAVFLSQLLFDASPLRSRFGIIRSGQTDAESAVNRFVMRLYLCWVPSAIIGAGSLMLARGRREWAGLAAALTAGFCSAALWASQPYGTYHRWLLPFKWPKLLSTGLLMLTLLLLAQLLAGAIRSAGIKRTRTDA